MTRPTAFLKAWVRAPLKIGAIAPSSQALARAMASQVDLSKGGHIVEVGAGTGAITRGLLAAGIPYDRLIVIEREKKLVDILHRQFPHLHILRADVLHLQATLNEIGVEKVNAVVSSLPLVSMPKEVQKSIVEQLVLPLGMDGKLIQFTYGPQSPITKILRRKNGIHARRMARVWLNIPPATVWVYRKSPK